MESKILAKLGIDPAFIFLFMLILIVVLFVLYVNVSLKYDRLKNSYASFMRGKDGKNLEESILTKFSELDGVAKIINRNRADVNTVFKNVELSSMTLLMKWAENSALPWHFWTVIIPDGS